MKRVLPVIVVAQFLATSLWFAGNASMIDIAKQFQLQPEYIAHLASVVQLGFICGTLFFSIFAIADRFSPSKIFFFSAVLAAIMNVCICMDGLSLAGLLLFRLMTGFFLAGVYPVGMKIAADYYREDLGKSLGYLLGALVLGTSLPFFLKSITAALPWKYVLVATSYCAVFGGSIVLLLVPDGPYRSKQQAFKLSSFLEGFRDRQFRSVALGYFGHMWELYSFWVFLPVMLSSYKTHFPSSNINVSFFSFLIIAVGSLSCIVAGMVAQSKGERKIAIAALSVSGICCVLSPLFLFNSSLGLLIAFLFVWSMAVIADSPLFSSLIAKNAPIASRGASLTIVNGIGFTITIASIQTMNALKNDANEKYIYMLLAIGPILGLIALLKKR